MLKKKTKYYIMMKVQYKYERHLCKFNVSLAILTRFERFFFANLDNDSRMNRIS